MLPRDEQADGRIADAIKRVPLEPLPPPVEVPKLLDKLTADFMDGTGHDTDLTKHLG